MTEKALDEQFIGWYWGDDGSAFFNDIQERLFDVIKKFNNFLGMGSIEQSDESLYWIYDALEKNITIDQMTFPNRIDVIIDEAKDVADISSYQIICNALNTLKAELELGEPELWDIEKERTKLYNVKISDFEYFELRYVVAESELEPSIQKLEKCKRYLEVKNPYLTAPFPKDIQTTPDEIAPQSKPKQPLKVIGEDDPGRNLFHGIEWKGTKTDLAEFITGLFRSGKIIKDGQPIQKKELQKIFEVIFNTKVSSVETLLKKRLQSEKNINNQMFIDDLEKYVTNIYKELAQEIRRENNP